MEGVSAGDSTFIRGRMYRTGEPVELVCEGGRILDIHPYPYAATLAGSADNGALPFIAPGLTDLQINGYAGIDLNSVLLTTKDIARLSLLLLSQGVTAYYPTVITNGAEATAALLRSIADACREDRLAASCIAGIHLEGPFLSPEEGPRGAHERRFIRPPDWELLQYWQQEARGLIRIVTLSPEWPEATGFIERCARHGIKAAIGHTAATPQQIGEAVEAGAVMSTHLGNGAHLTLPRHPNYIWEQLARDQLWSCLIADGFHLPDAVLKVILKVKGHQAVLVSDSVYLAGLKPGEYHTHIGGDVVLEPGGRLHLKRNAELLAGSARPLPHGIHHLAVSGLASLADAWEMASLRPAAMMGLPGQAGLTAGAPADVVLFTPGPNGICVHRTYKGGVMVYDRGQDNV
ncbi:amidohydrolase family protein [Paenibacillus sp. FSL K6-1096]|uniref:N-acetylglucosamine-6-phosphate deacetylase n=1 Tax=Paenibacillus sp. FSL K6-1096 TaxID=2921460 RepID=UPI0030EC6234